MLHLGSFTFSYIKNDKVVVAGFFMIKTCFLLVTLIVRPLMFFLCIFLQGMSMQKKAAEDRLANTGSGQSFLSRQRQATSSRRSYPGHVQPATARQMAVGTNIPGELKTCFTNSLKFLTIDVPILRHSISIHFSIKFVFSYIVISFFSLDQIHEVEMPGKAAQILHHFFVFFLTKHILH